MAATRSIKDVTGLAHKVGETVQCSEDMAQAQAHGRAAARVTYREPYTLKCNDGVLYNLGLLTT